MADVTLPTIVSVSKIGSHIGIYFPRAIPTSLKHKSKVGIIPVNDDIFIVVNAKAVDLETASTNAILKVIAEKIKDGATATG